MSGTYQNSEGCCGREQEPSDSILLKDGGQLNDALKASIGTVSFSFMEKDLLIILSKAFAGESRLSSPLDMDFFGICLLSICHMLDTGERGSS